MSSANVLKLPSIQETGSQSEAAPSREAQVTGQVNENRPAVEQVLIIPTEWTEDDPDFTVEELWAEQRVQIPASDDIDELRKICDGFDSITAD